MTTLNKQPIGLLDFFGIKNGGRYPQFLTEGLQGQLNLLPLYECASEINNGSTTGNLVGGVTLFGPAGLTTDPGDTWHFQAFSLKFNTIAGGAYASCRLGVYYSPTATFIGLTEERFGINTAQPVIKALAATDVWIGPGWSLAFDCTELLNVVPFEASWLGTEYRW